MPIKHKAVFTKKCPDDPIARRRIPGCSVGNEKPFTPQTRYPPKPAPHKVDPIPVDPPPVDPIPPFTPGILPDTPNKVPGSSLNYVRTDLKKFFDKAPIMTPEDRIAAEMSAASYIHDRTKLNQFIEDSNISNAGWKLNETLTNASREGPQNKELMNVYERVTSNGKLEYATVYRGTEDWIGNDGIENATNTLQQIVKKTTGRDVPTTQQADIIKKVEDLAHNYYSNKNNEITIPKVSAGHSRGGAQVKLGRQRLIQMYGKTFVDNYGGEYTVFDPAPGGGVFSQGSNIRTIATETDVVSGIDRIINTVTRNTKNTLIAKSETGYDPIGSHRLDTFVPNLPQLTDNDNDNDNDNLNEDTSAIEGIEMRDIGSAEPNLHSTTHLLDELISNEDYRPFEPPTEGPAGSAVNVVNINEDINIDTNLSLPDPLTLSKPTPGFKTGVADVIKSTPQSLLTGYVASAITDKVDPKGALGHEGDLLVTAGTNVGLDSLLFGAGSDAILPVFGAYEGADKAGRLTDSATSSWDDRTAAAMVTGAASGAGAAAGGLAAYGMSSAAASAAASMYTAYTSTAVTAEAASSAVELTGLLGGLTAVTETVETAAVATDAAALAQGGVDAPNDVAGIGVTTVAGILAGATAIGTGLNTLFGKHDSDSERIKKATAKRDEILKKFYGQENLMSPGFDPKTVLSDDEIKFISALDPQFFDNANKQIEDKKRLTLLEKRITSQKMGERPKLFGYGWNNPQFGLLNPDNQKVTNIYGTKVLNLNESDQEFINKLDPTFFSRYGQYQDLFRDEMMYLSPNYTLNEYQIKNISDKNPTFFDNVDKLNLKDSVKHITKLAHSNEDLKVINQNLDIENETSNDGGFTSEQIDQLETGGEVTTNDSTVPFAAA